MNDEIIDLSKDSVRYVCPQQPCKVSVSVHKSVASKAGMLKCREHQQHLVPEGEE